MSAVQHQGTCPVGIVNESTILNYSSVKPPPSRHTVFSSAISPHQQSSANQIFISWVMSTLNGTYLQQVGLHTDTV
jgi:hypothetical protein